MFEAQVRNWWHQGAMEWQQGALNLHQGIPATHCRHPLKAADSTMLVMREDSEQVTPIAVIALLLIQLIKHSTMKITVRCKAVSDPPRRTRVHSGRYGRLQKFTIAAMCDWVM